MSQAVVLVQQASEHYCIVLPSMSLKRAVSMSLGSFRDSVGSRLSNDGSSNDKLSIVTVLSGFPDNKELTVCAIAQRKKKWGNFSRPYICQKSPIPSPPEASGK